MNLKPIESTAAGAFSVLTVSVLGGVGSAYTQGAIHQWTDLGKAFSSALLIGIGATIGWILLKSPLTQTKNN